MKISSKETLKYWSLWINMVQPVFKIQNEPEYSKWKCYLWGNKPDNDTGLSYIPIKDNVPNFFVRWMMKVCFDCTWIKGD